MSAGLLPAFVDPWRRRASRWARPGPRIVAWVMLALAVLMLGASVRVGTLVLEQAQALRDTVAYTQEVVDANVRTLGQVQRELLRLQLALDGAGTASRGSVELQLALTDQRVQEGALPYQQQSLGSVELLHRSQELARRWQSDVRPALDASVAAGQPADEPSRQALTALEKDYNQLVSDGEINRKVRAGTANAQTRSLLSETRTLLVSLAVTIVSLLVLITLAGLAFARVHRQREASAASLLELNAELRLHALVAHATDNLVVVTGPDGRVQWVNDAFVRTTGYTLDQVRDRRPGALLQSAATDPETVELMRCAVAARQAFSCEVLNVSATGREYWLSIEAHPVHDDRGRLTHYVAVETDITERRAIEDNLRRSTETAMSLAAEKTSFLATMSHEIRTPLNAVLGLTALLSGTDLDEEQTEYVRTAQRSGHLLLALINDILDFSALESGHSEIEHRPFSLHEVLHQVEGLFAADARARGLTLEITAAPSLPPLLVSDEAKIRQVLINLVGNGLKFTAQGRVTVTTDLVPDGPGHRLRFVVADTGIGMAADRLERIFLPFTQVDPSTTREYGGTGLGLSICRLIADHLHGSLQVTSRLGEGSAFALELPVAVAEERLARAAHALTGAELGPDAPAPLPSLSTLRVLLAEDESVNRLVALRMLERLGVRADVAVDGVEVLERVSQNHYDVVLMDVHMPRLDGIAAAVALHARLGAARPRIVALTANALGGDRDRLLAAGMDDYLSKPVDMASLAEALARVA